MNQRVMIIGISPEYRYPGKLQEWSKSNTLFAANLGACLITNSIIRQFNGTYVEDFSDVKELRADFDACVLAFATHIHPTRDIWLFTKLVEQLDMPTFFISGGITDYAKDTACDYPLHASVKRLLEIVSSSSEWIGVRGHYTANVLYRSGFRKVIPVGCPSLFWNLDGPIEIHPTGPPSSVVVPYHLTFAKQAATWLEGKTLLGQDFQDQAVFTEDLAADTKLQNWLRDQFADARGYEKMRDIVKSSGVWKPTFREWFECIGEYDFAIGPRLHGCVAALIQKIPTLMTTRDLRGREIAEFFDIPSMSYSEVSAKTLTQLYESLDYFKFNETHSRRLSNYLQFLKENGLKSEHAHPANGAYSFSAKDMTARDFISSKVIDDLARRIVELEARTAPWKRRIAARLKQSVFARFAKRVIHSSRKA